MRLALAVYAVHFAHVLLGVPVEGLEQTLVLAYGSRA